MRYRNVISLLIASMGLCALSSAASASTSFTGSSGNLAASVTFDLSGTTLKVSLTNTASVAAAGNGNMLTGCFWDSSTSIGGTLTNLTLGAGSVIVPDAGSGDTNIGMFGYGSNIPDGPGNRKNGIGSAGFVTYNSTFLPVALGATTPPNSPDGPFGSLVPTAGTTGNINGAVVKNTEVWWVTGVNANFSLANISNVFFQYGTSLSEAGFPSGGGPPPPVPVPAAIWAGGSMLAALGAKRFLRRKA